MRIAYSLGSLNRGGTETLLLDVLQSIDIKSLILIYRKSGELERDFLNENISVFKLDVKSVIGKIFYLRKLLKNNKIDIVHAHQPLDAFYSIIANFGTKRKTFLTIHGFDFQDSIFYKLLLYFVLQFNNKNIFVSETQKKYYKKKYFLNSWKQSIVYNGVNFDKIVDKSVQPNFNKLRSELNLNSDSDLFLLGTVGNFVNVRNQLILCNFLKMFKENKQDFHFVFVGKKSSKHPQLYDECVTFCNENELMNNVSFLGTRNDVPEILNNMDAFLYASEHDTFGIAVVEAIAAGIPVFVNDMETMLEITDHGKLANIYKSNDINDLFAIFEKYLSNVDYYKKQAHINAEIIRKKYSIQNHISNLYQVYNSL